MALSNSRPAFYAEDALNENDYKNISSTLARGALVSEVSDVKWDITTPFMIRINSGGKNVNFLLDGDLWNAFDEGGIIVPKGKHRLKFDTLKCEPLQYHLKTISGELTSANFSNDQFNFTYIENINYCYAIIDKQPVKIEIDGKISEVETLKNGNEYSLKLPKGKHKVAVIF